MSIYRTQAPSLESETTRRKRKYLITRKVHHPRKKRCVETPPPETVASAAVPPPSLLSRLPAMAASCSKTQLPVETDITLDPVQIVVDTFDNVMITSLSNPPSFNLEKAVSNHIYRSLFKQGVQTLANSFPQPLTPSALIDVTISTLKSLGLL